MLCHDYNSRSCIFDVGNGKDYGKLSGRIVDSDMHDVGRFLNRLLGLPPEIQNRLTNCQSKNDVPELFEFLLNMLIATIPIQTV